jgi:IstB-like ATP binding protein
LARILPGRAPLRERTHDSDHNQSFGAWGEAFGTTAILDRVLHHAITVNIRGNSYPLKEKLKAGLIRAEEPGPAIN